MNSLSWLLYWADVLPQLAGWLCIASFVTFLAFIGLSGFYFSCKDSTRRESRWHDGDYVHEYKPDDEAKAARSFWFAPYTAALFFVLWGSSFLVPTKDTFYLIAASEAGEQVLQTPEFSKIRKVINNYLDKTINEDSSTEGDSKENK